MDKKPLVVIPARYGSKRLPGKPLMKIAGLPAILHTLNAVCCTCRMCVTNRKYDVCLATDHPEIKEAVNDLRPDIDVIETSADLESGTDRVAQVAFLKPYYDLYINVQGDMPFINCEVWVEPLIDFMAENADFDMSTPVAAHNFVDQNFRRKTVTQHVGIYAYRRDALLEFYENRINQHIRATEIKYGLEQLRAVALGMRIKRFAIHKPAPAELNTADDLRYLDYIACRVSETSEDYWMEMQEKENERENDLSDEQPDPNSIH